MRRFFWLIPFLVASCSGPTETVSLSGSVTLPQHAASAFRVEGAPVLISNFDGSLGHVKASTLDAAGRFNFRIERSSLPLAPQWFKLVVIHPKLNGPMLSRALVLSRAGKGAEGLELSPFSSLTQMAIEYQYQMDPARVPATLSPVDLENALAEKLDTKYLDAAFHAAYGKYAEGNAQVAPAADSELAAGACELLFTSP